MPAGAIVVYTGKPQQYYSGGGGWSTRLWPVEEKRGPGGGVYYALCDIEDAFGMDCKPIKSFDDVSVLVTMHMSALAWWVANNYLPQCSTLPEDGLLMAVPYAEEPVLPCLKWVAKNGWRGHNKDDMTLLCSMELQIGDAMQGLSLIHI